MKINPVGSGWFALRGWPDRRGGRRESGARLDKALAEAGLADETPAKKIGAFSRGMRQRPGIAELLIEDVRVAFLEGRP